MQRPVLVTSFGFNADSNTSRDATPFDKLPPAIVSKTINSTFSPDYASLVLAPEMIMDISSLAYLKEVAKGPFSDLAETYSLLAKEGYLRLLDYQSEIKKYIRLLELMVESDMKNADSWHTPLMESIELWSNVANSTRLDVGTYQQKLFHMGLHEIRSTASHLLIIEELKKDPSDAFRSTELLLHVIEPYLRHININLLLSALTDSTIHDWSDFLPIYQKKAIISANGGESSAAAAKQLNKLFEISFPEFAITNRKALLKALGDKRIVELRKLVAGAVSGEVTFDEEFARRILMEVFKDNHRISRTRKIASYASIPLGLIPYAGSVLQKGADEAVEHIVSKRLEEKHPWFYLLSELAE